jgi:hypothetical protein
LIRIGAKLSRKELVLDEKSVELERIVVHLLGQIEIFLLELDANQLCVLLDQMLVASTQALGYVI